jgi:hypothetical protein
MKTFRGGRGTLPLACTTRLSIAERASARSVKERRGFNHGAASAQLPPDKSDISKWQKE